MKKNPQGTARRFAIMCAATSRVIVGEIAKGRHGEGYCKEVAEREGLSWNDCTWMCGEGISISIEL